jgi:hypothetical protein
MFTTPEFNCRQLSEAEITYFIDIYKRETEKWMDPAILAQVMSQAAFTAKMITKDTIEGISPMCMLIDNCKKK